MIELIALLITILYLGVTLGLRTWLQARRTGEGGFNGISGEVGSLEWLGGVSFIAAIALGVLAPLTQWVGLVDPIGGLPSHSQLAVAIAFICCGILITGASQSTMGNSWRIGVDQSESTALVTQGIFGWARNPVFTGMLATSFGIVLLIPNAVAIAGWVTLLVAVELQVRSVEEPYLMAEHEEYAEYAGQVGRFVPFVGKIPNGGPSGE